MSAIDQERSGTMAPDSRRRRIPGLDGLRAVAVLAVMLFHTGSSPLQGGFLGVDIFFVLSGFLIGGILLDERARSGRIALGAFWLRRARRLAPALLLLLVGVALARIAAPHPSADTWRAEMLAALTYTTNWFQIVTGADYFSQFGAAQPLMHTWSLAIEEQFYVFFAVLMAVLLKRARSRVVLIVLIVLTAVSATWMFLLADADPVWAYYGTTTRIQALLVGAVLALCARRGSSAASDGDGRWPRLLGWVAVAVMAGFLLLPASNDVMFRGGFLLVAAASAVVIWAITTGGALASALSWRPLVALGTISYGVYLWHWPVFLLLDTDRPGTRLPEQLWAFVVTIVIASVSYVVVERPIRQGRFTTWRPSRQWATYGVAGLVVAALAMLPARTLAGSAEVAWPAASEVPARVLVGGDSVMLSLNQHFPREVYPDTLADGPVSLGCGFVGLPFDREGQLEVPDKCEGWQDVWRSKVEEVDPQVSFIGSSVWDSFDRRIGDSTYGPGTPEFDTAFIDGFRQAIALAGRDGQIPVYVVGPACLASGVDPVINDPERAKRIDQLTRTAASGAANVHFLDTRGLTCTQDGAASDMASKQPLRYDGVHWNEYGARIVWSQALAQAARDAGGRSGQ
ncbi:MAG TPA: acyltransferase family protein [Actinomycetota bacterium]|nr:acyltransferase family protein [Actinomycetota bacterium]HNL52703.1 acyltransferase family protein [Actinomycetota bacterium]HNO16481.1 acyltransferase family protein [Actinomycetota bacterium]HUM87610.1 acyltransferase family protein [Actinomycetota bacterium]